MYQESSRIEATLVSLAAAGEVLGDHELVLVDDGSTDGTAETAERALEELKLEATVVRLGRNSGKGAAISAGVGASHGRTVAFSDADLSAPPDAIALCFELIESGTADVVVTTRRHPESVITTRPSVTRRAASGGFARLIRWAGVRQLSDTQCGLKAFTHEAARALFKDLTVQRFAFDVEVLLRAELAGLRVVEMPIEWRHVDESTLRPLRDGARTALDVVRLRGRLRGWQADGAGLPVVALLERRHWWYVARRNMATDAIRDLAPEGPALDVGCGTGGVVDRLGELGFAPRVGVDQSTAALGFAAGPASDHAELAAASTERLPFRDGTFSCLTALGVLEHIDDDLAALREYARVVRPGGLVVVAVPANPRAWSSYDVALGHRRRYSRRLLEQRLRDSGLELVRTARFHAWLSPVTFLLGRTPLRALLLQAPERATFVHPRLNRLLVAATHAERRAASLGRLPFGQALLAAGRRPG